MDAHKVLGVKPGDDEKTIKAAYRKLAMEHHPDKNGGSKESESKFKEINEAYSKLTGGSQTVFEDSFEDYGFSQTIFDQIFRNGGGSRTTVNRSAVDPELLIKGGTFQYRVQILEKQNGALRPKLKTVNLTIEPDSPVGIRIAVPDTQPHHVFVELVPGDTEKYRVIDLIHLCETKRISVFEAMRGSSIEIVAPNGKKIAVKFPSGTQHGSIHRVRGLGLRHARGRGDYLIQFDVVIPTITTEEELLSRFRGAKLDDVNAE